MIFKKSTSVFLLAAIAGCSLPSIKALPPDIGPAEGISTDGDSLRQINRPATAYEPKLYGRDGSVVGEQVPGTTAMAPSTGQAASSEVGTRSTLLELYQAALAEKEQLTFELQAMASALQQAEAREAQTAALVVDLEKKLTDMNARGEELAGHNVELAERLSTAQIRRLQSEKLLLVTKLDWRRVQSAMYPTGAEESDGEAQHESPLDGAEAEAEHGDEHGDEHGES